MINPCRRRMRPVLWLEEANLEDPQGSQESWQEIKDFFLSYCRY
jgi:hypothetical protein